MGLEIDLFGPFRIAHHGQLLHTVDQPREQSLLAYLLLHAGTPIPRRYLASLFWPETTEAQARNNLRQLLHQLRHALPESEAYIYSDASILHWRTSSAYLVDVFQFEEALERAESAERSGDLAAAQTALEKALNFYRGDLLVSCYDDWILDERERLHRLCLNALEQTVQLLEEQRDYAAAIPFAQRLIRHDRLHENGYRLLMRLYAITDERASALRTYHICADILENELGVEPELATREIFRRLRSGQELPEALSPPIESTSVLPLTGRSEVWAQLQTEWQRAASGEQRFALLSGEAGIGKSRLAAELLHWAARQGYSTAKSRAYAAEGTLSYSPLVDWLRSEDCRISISRLDKIWLSEIARLVPELLAETPDIPAPDPLAEQWQRQKFFQALARAILGMRQPLLLLLDDLQWCDPEILGFLHYLIRADNQACLMLIGTMRAGDLVANPALAALLMDLRGNDQLTEMVLTQLDEADTARLAGHTAGYELDGDTALRLFQETEGNPLFIIETIRAGYLDREHDLDSWDGTTDVPGSRPLDLEWLPEKVRHVIAGRLAQLSQPARQLAGLAATFGRAFSIEVLVQASDASEDELLRWLDELWQRRIVRVLDENKYDFTHDKLRQVAYSEASLPRRRLLHLRVARALEIVHEASLDPFCGQLGLHFERAGKTERAIHYYYRAALVAEEINASREAVSLLRRALALLETLPEKRERDALELKLQTALVVSLVSTLGHGAPEVIHTRDRALALSRRLEQSPSPPILRGLAIDYVVLARFNQAMDYSEQLLRLAERNQNPLLAVEANYAMGVTMFWLGNFRRSRRYLEQAIALYSLQDSRAHISSYGQDPKVVCLSRLAFSLWFLGYPAQAVDTGGIALQFAREIGHPFSLAYALFWNFQVLIHTCELDVAASTVQSLMELSQEHQLRHFLFGGTILQGWLRAESGEIETGMAMIRDGMERFRAGGAAFMRPLFISLLAEYSGRQGNVHQGLELLDEAQTLMQESAERWCEAEIFRRQGVLLLLQSDNRKAEEAFSKAMQVAHHQGARMLELRTALGLGRMWLEEGKHGKVRSLLEPLVRDIDEGRDNCDLRDAHHLLEEAG
jgi:DNA-binding SARP family transcriptional activator/predicted ATPase